VCAHGDSAPMRSMPFLRGIILSRNYSLEWGYGPLRSLGPSQGIAAADVVECPRCASGGTLPVGGGSHLAGFHVTIAFWPHRATQILARP